MYNSAKRDAKSELHDMTRTSSRGRRTLLEQILQGVVEVLGCRGVHGNGDGLQAQVQCLPYRGLNLPAQDLQPPVDALEHAALPLIACSLHILPEVPHLSTHSRWFGFF